MATGIELIVSEAFGHTFGTDITGRILFSLFGLGFVLVFYAVLKPPTPVLLTASGLIVLLIFGSMFGGAGIYPTLAFVSALVFAILLFAGFRRLVPNW